MFIVNLFMFILIKIVAGVISERESSGVIGCGLKCTIFMCFLMVFVQIYYHQFCLNFHEPLVNGIVFLLSSLCSYSMLVSVRGFTLTFLQASFLENYLSYKNISGGGHTALWT